MMTDHEDSESSNGLDREKLSGWIANVVCAIYYIGMAVAIIVLAFYWIKYQSEYDNLIPISSIPFKSVNLVNGSIYDECKCYCYCGNPINGGGLALDLPYGNKDITIRCDDCECGGCLVEESYWLKRTRKCTLEEAPIFCKNKYNKYPYFGYDIDYELIIGSYNITRKKHVKPAAFWALPSFSNLKKIKVEVTKIEEKKEGYPLDNAHALGYNPKDDSLEDWYEVEAKYQKQLRPFQEITPIFIMLFSCFVCVTGCLGISTCPEKLKKKKKEGKEKKEKVKKRRKEKKNFNFPKGR